MKDFPDLDQAIQNFQASPSEAEHRKRFAEVVKVAKKHVKITQAPDPDTSTGYERDLFVNNLRDAIDPLPEGESRF